MFIVSITYTVSLDLVDSLLAEHVKYLKIQYKKGNFIASGRKVPRTGGIILSQVNNLKTLQKIINEAPFKINDLAKYDIQEFIPSMSSEKFINLKEE